MTIPERDAVLWELLVRSDEGMSRQDTYNAVMERVVAREKAVRVEARLKALEDAIEACDLAVDEIIDEIADRAEAASYRIRELIEKERATGAQARDRRQRGRARLAGGT